MRALGKACIHATFNGCAAADAASGRNVDGKFGTVRGVNAQTADDQVALCHGVNLAICTIKRRHYQSTATQRLGLAKCGNGDVKTLARFCKRRQLCGNHNGCGIF